MKKILNEKAAKAHKKKLIKAKNVQKSKNKKRRNKNK